MSKEHSPSQTSEQDELLRPLNPQVISTLVESHRKFLAFIEKRVGSKAIAEEILQTAFVKTLEKGTNLDDSEGAVAWFYRLLRNAIVDHYRHEGAEGRALAREALDQASSPALIDQELEDAICACMKDLLPTLKPEYEEIVRRVDLEDGSLADLAAAKGITVNNATVRLHRARKALKAQLERSCGTCATHGCLDCGCSRTIR